MLKIVVFGMFQDPRLYFLFIDYAFFSFCKTMLANTIGHFWLHVKLEAFYYKLLDFLKLLEFSRIWAWICECLRGPGIDSASLCIWRVGATNKYVCRTGPPGWDSSPGLLKRFTVQIRALAPKQKYPTNVITSCKDYSARLAQSEKYLVIWFVKADVKLNKK